ncbi:MAG: restriction endonuclease [Burkholderiaceae bacterium]|nr:restriction endonuclease [Burkholderiaceae bacterium]
MSVLATTPWQFSAALGCIAFAALRWLVPYVVAGNVYLGALAPLARLCAWIALLFFGAMALLSHAIAKKRGNRAPNASHAQQSNAKRTRPQQKISPPAIDQAAVAPTIENATPAPPPTVPATWTLEALRSLEWKRFELLCARYYETVAFKAETLTCGPDGGIDVKLYKQDDSKPIAIVQCKAWNSSDVGVKELRELLGVMTHEKVKRGIFITTAGYTKDAATFGSANPIQLLDGAAFLAKLKELPEARQKALLDFAFDGDYKTPTCPSCGIKMIRREGKKGAFFGCRNFPRCRRTFGV